jgi:hypothetical protein
MRLKKMPDTLLLMDRLRGPSSQVYFTISALNKITFRKQGVPKRMREREFPWKVMMTVFVGHIFNNKSDIFSIEGIQTWQPLLASGSVRQLCVDQDRLGGASQCHWILTLLDLSPATKVSVTLILLDLSPATKVSFDIALSS